LFDQSLVIFILFLVIKDVDWICGGAYLWNGWRVQIIVGWVHVQYWPVIRAGG